MKPCFITQLQPSLVAVTMAIAAAVAVATRKKRKGVEAAVATEKAKEKREGRRFSKIFHNTPRKIELSIKI